MWARAFTGPILAWSGARCVRRAPDIYLLVPDDGAIVAAQLKRHCDRLVVAISPEPAVVPGERRLEAPFARGFAAPFFIGHVLPVRMGMKVEIDPPPFRAPCVEQARAFLHRCLYLGIFARREGKGDLILPCLLSLGLSDEETKNVVYKRRGFFAVCLRVRGGLCGELLLDFAHLGQPKQTADPGGVFPQFSGHVDHDADCERPDTGYDRRTAKLCIGRQIFELGLGCVMHEVSPSLMCWRCIRRSAGTSAARPDRP